MRLLLGPLVEGEQVVEHDLVALIHDDHGPPLRCVLDVVQAAAVVEAPLDLLVAVDSVAEEALECHLVIVHEPLVREQHVDKVLSVS